MTTDIDFEGSASKRGLPWAWILNTPDNYGLAFKEEQAENCCADAEIPPGVGESVTITMEDGDRISVRLFRQPRLVILRLSRLMAEFSVGNASCRVSHVKGNIYPTRPRYVTKAMVMLVDEVGVPISVPFQVTLKGTAKDTWAESIRGASKEPMNWMAAVEAKAINVPKDGVYVGMAPKSKGLSFGAGLQKEGLRLVREAKGSQRWSPDNWKLFVSSMIFRPVFLRTPVGTTEKKSAVIVVGYMLPEPGNMGKLFVPKAYHQAIQDALDLGDAWEQGLEKLPPTRAEARQAIDYTKWGEDYDEEISAPEYVPAVPDYAPVYPNGGHQETYAAPQPSAPQPVGAPFLGAEPLF